MKDERRMSFDRVAELYDEVRPGYPDELVQDIIKLSGIQAEARILEVGCGTGQATRPFAERRYHMVCLEIGNRLAEIATQNLAGFPGVEVVNAAFEDWESEPEHFDLVISGTAFHWVDPTVGYTRAAGVLKPGGTLAVFWNFHVRPEAEPFQSMQEHYRRHAPQMVEVTPWEERLQKQKADFEASGRFTPIRVREYRWETESSAEDYIRGMGTQSSHIMLEPEARRKLLAGIRREIERHGGTVRQPWVTALLLAQRL
ncbi:MAG: class I SAM-dependent methyltransferase, partial [candidate division WOR-3 bacterium]